MKRQSQTKSAKTQKKSDQQKSNILDSSHVASFLGAQEDPEPEPETTAAPEPEKQEVKPLSAKERYLEALKEAEISEEEATEIIDSLLTNMVYEETSLIRGKIKFKLRTRTAGQMDRVQERIKKANPNNYAEINNLLNKYNLASSLSHYDGHDLEADSDEGFEQALSLVDRLPGPLFRYLVDKLARFDEKLYLVMQEGALENF